MVDAHQMRFVAEQVREWGRIVVENHRCDVEDWFELQRCGLRSMLLVCWGIRRLPRYRWGRGGSIRQGTTVPTNNESDRAIEGSR